MKAFLWDGNKKILGTIEYQESNFIFLFDDFALCNLSINIEYSDIKDISFHKIFNIQVGGVSINTMDNKNYIFILEEPLQMKLKLESFIGINH
jgi:hypothetical protein